MERLRTTYENIIARLRSLSQESPMGKREETLLKEAQKTRKEFEEAMDKNFETPKGLKAIHELSKALNIYLEGKINDGVLEKAFETYKILLHTFGLFEKIAEQSAEGSELLDHVLDLLVDLRQDARANKDYATSDKIRDKLAEIGVVLEDSAKGTVWKIKQ